jgi:hypothetical protein
MKRLVLILLIAAAAVMGWYFTRPKPVEVITADQVNANTFKGEP